jgi:hypothetical protein
MGSKRITFRHFLAAPALAAVVFALAPATPAFALTGKGVSGALRVQNAGLITNAAAPSRPRTCEKSRDKEGLVTHSAAGADNVGRKFVPVACEQPPKSEVNLPGALSKAAANAFAALG